MASFDQRYIWDSFKVVFVLHFSSWFVFICKDPQIAKIFLKNKAGEIVLSDIKISHRAVLIKIAGWGVRTDRWTGGAEESPEIGPHGDSGLTDSRGDCSVLREGRLQKK